MNLTHTPATRRALRTIAVLEALKGLIAIAAGIGLLSLLHHDLHHIAEALIGHFGLSPGDHYPSIVLHYADLLADANVRSIEMLLAAYALLRLCESYGLWRERKWGEWLGALSGALYVPYEMRHLWLHPHWSSFLILTGNLLVVAFLAYRIWRERRDMTTR